MMPNALPLRKEFSVITSGPGLEVTDDNKGGNMRTIKALAKAVKKDGKLKTPIV